MLSEPTQSRGEIRIWAALHSATPCRLRRQDRFLPPINLRFLFGDAAAAGTAVLEPISWAVFFAEFEAQNLSMAYDDTPEYVIFHADRNTAA